MPVDPSQLDKARAAIKKQYDASYIRKADTYTDPSRISTGSLELDLITRGGIPRGRICHFYGGHFSAKTMIALQTIGNAQKMGLTCAYYNLEKQLTPSWAKAHGVDLSSLEVVDTTVIEEVGSILELLLPSVHVHVIDSIPAGVSQDELAAETGDWLPGISARAWGKTMRRAQRIFDQEENTIVMINHTGTVFGKYAGGEEPKGGKLLEYLSSLSIEFRRTSWLFRKSDQSLGLEGSDEGALDKRDKEPGGIEFAVRVKKSRVSTPLKTARMRLDFRTGEIDDLWSLAKAAEVYELIDKNSSWFTMPDGTKVQGESGVRGYIESNDDFKQLVINKIVEDA